MSWLIALAIPNGRCQVCEALVEQTLAGALEHYGASHRAATLAAAVTTAALVIWAQSAVRTRG